MRKNKLSGDGTMRKKPDMIAVVVTLFVVGVLASSVAQSALF